jgi:hypothetical protein
VGNVRRRHQMADPVAVNGDDFENAFGGDDIVAE